jgi:hypothetical protein
VQQHEITSTEEWQKVCSVWLPTSPVKTVVVMRLHKQVANLSGTVLQWSCMLLCSDSQVADQ